MTKGFKYIFYTKFGTKRSNRDQKNIMVCSVNFNINADNVTVTHCNIHVPQQGFLTFQTWGTIWWWHANEISREHAVLRELTHCSLVTPYGVRYLGQDRFRQWLGACRHRAIIWTSVDLSAAKSCSIHSRVMFTWILKMPITKLCLKLKHLKLHPHLSGTILYTWSGLPATE